MRLTRIRQLSPLYWRGRVVKRSYRYERNVIFMAIPCLALMHSSHLSQIESRPPVFHRCGEEVRTRPSVSSKVYLSSILSPRRLHGYNLRFASTGRAGGWRARALGAITSQDMPPLTFPAPTLITLTPKEEEIFDVIRAACSYHKLNTTVRVAGGWVRDKILGKLSDDIDIAVDNMLGEEFAELVNEYLHEKGEETKNVAVIKTNPEKSKHLATATFRIGERAVDVNHLRSEEYASTSRIPEVKVGTPWEDSHRRDLTMNTLFYNINSNTIEDYTHRGLQDLRSGLARTPLAPVETLVDDPLRVLRSLRFAARFNLTLDPDLEKACHHEEVKLGLRDKVSRERFGQEISKALEGPGEPASLLSKLVEYGLISTVFSSPPIQPTPLPNSSPEYLTKDSGSRWQMGREMVMEMQRRISQDKLPYLRQKVDNIHDFQPILLLSALLAKGYGLGVMVGRKKRPVSMVFTMLANGIKIPHKESETVDTVVHASPILQHMASRLAAIRRANPNATFQTGLSPAEARVRNGLEALRLETGLVLDDIKDLWRLSLELAKVDRGSVEQKADTEAVSESDLNALGEWIVESGLGSVWETPHLLDGSAIMDRFKVQGGMVGQLKRTQREWQLLNPEGSEKDCEIFLKDVMFEAAAHEKD
ncbi:hypothetical protein AAMO2058_000735100 [Amorphochlora amoebiformis]